MNAREILELIKNASWTNPITAQQIGRILNTKDKWDLSQPGVRKIIRELISRRHPIGSRGSGYFYIKNEDQYYEYIRSLKSRIRGIQSRINELSVAFKFQQGKRIIKRRKKKRVIKRRSK